MILDLYSHIKESRERFIDEVFESEIYAGIKPKLTVVDLGAYLGEFGFYCLPFAGKIYAVEPDPRPYKIMVETVEKFGLKDNFLTYPIAIAGKNGKRRFHASGHGGSSLLGRENGDVNELEVDCLTLNSFLEREKIDKVDILKIDVESAEDEIFGAEDFAEASLKVKHIIGEPHRGEEVRTRLESLGYKVKFYNQTFEAWKNE